MVKRASFCILADVRSPSIFHTLTYTELEGESSLKFCRARKFSGRPRGGNLAGLGAVNGGRKLIHLIVVIDDNNVNWQKNIAFFYGETR